MTATDLSSRIEKTIRAQRNPALPPEFVLPHYGGLSIANIGPTVAELLGGHVPGALPMPRDVWADLAPGVRRVVPRRLEGGEIWLGLKGGTSRAVGEQLAREKFGAFDMTVKRIDGGSIWLSLTPRSTSGS